MRRWIVILAATALAACGSHLQTDDAPAGAGGDPGAGESETGPRQQAADGPTLRARYCQQCMPDALPACIADFNDCWFANLTVAYLTAMVGDCNCDGECALASELPAPGPAFEQFAQACDAVCGGPSTVCDEAVANPGLFTEDVYARWASCLEQSTCKEASRCRTTKYTCSL